MGERLACQPQPEPGSGLAALRQFFEHRLVVRRVDEHGDVLVVLGRSPQQGRPADVYQIDRWIGGERVEVADDDVDQIEVVGLQIPQVRGVSTVGKDAAVDPGMEGDDPMAQHGGKAGDVGHVGDRNARLGDGRRRSTRGDQVDVQGM